ncbi:hypothetical protein GQ53DRAFT_746965 [Thozetella sp. PMI_491]|nr:hypothetical protein GQ53DRAFT_746965 [Thozetella sp. PMI_491]
MSLGVGCRLDQGLGGYALPACYVQQKSHAHPASLVQHRDARAPPKFVPISLLLLGPSGRTLDPCPLSACFPYSLYSPGSPNAPGALDSAASPAETKVAPLWAVDLECGCEAHSSLGAWPRWPRRQQALVSLGRAGARGERIKQREGGEPCGVCLRRIRILDIQVPEWARRCCQLEVLSAFFESLECHIQGLGQVPREALSRGLEGRVYRLRESAHPQLGIAWHEGNEVHEGQRQILESLGGRRGTRSTQA